MTELPAAGPRHTCEHGVELGELDEWLSAHGGAARSARCPDCWPDAAGLAEFTEPAPIEELEWRLRRFFERS